MTMVRRLQAAAAFGAALLAATCWQFGSAGPRRISPLSSASRPAYDFLPGPTETGGLFASRPVISYAAPNAQQLFALQLKPNLAQPAVQPRDLVVVIDTSASQAGAPLQAARKLLAELAKQAKPEDRVAVWTVNTPDETRDLTRGLRSPGDKELAKALHDLEKVIYPAGATDLKNGLAKVLKSLAPMEGRRTSVVYVGDGDSVLEPLSDTDRTHFAAELTARQVPFIPVPLGKKIIAKTIHGLAHATGGLVFRLGATDKPAGAATRLLAAADAPVLFPTKAEFSDAVVNVLPNRLPPLRGDVPTLVAGNCRGAKEIECRIEGTVAGKPVSVTIKEAVPAPEASNFFLVNLVKQWGEFDRSAPAVMRADRGLALSFEQTRLARDEFLTQANWALGLEKLQAAENLFKAAQQVDPQGAEAAAGLRVVERLRSGEINRDELRRQVNDTATTMRTKAPAGTQEPVPVPSIPATSPAVPDPTSGPGLLEAERRRRAVQEQQVTQLVEDAIRQARTLINSDPDAAYDLLKRQLGSVRDNGDLSETVRSTLANRLESSLRTVQAEGARIRLRQEADLRARIAAETRRGAELARVSEEEMIRQRVKIFGEMMDRARYDEAYKEALELGRDLIRRGRTPPPAVTAAYTIGLNATNIRDYQEIRRLNEERYLLTMLSVDRSAIPFPDEPPVAFPPAAIWRELSEFRKDRYSAENLGGFTRRTTEIRDRLSRPVTLDREYPGVPLRDFLDDLVSRYDLTFIINPVPFKDAGIERPDEQSVRLPKMPGVSLSTLLSYALSQINGTYVVRRDYVEITTRKAAGLEKVVRAYPVADLVIPFPNAVDPNSLQQNLQVLGSSLSANGQAIFGSAGGGLNFGNFGIFGGAGFVPGGIGGVGGIGGLGGGGGQTFLGGAQGQQGGALGFAGGQQNVNLGFGGGVLGFGGGQQGQFGNLGGQFGLQGGDTSAILISLIKDVIAPKEWNDRAGAFIQATALSQPEDELPQLDITLLNAVTYYQPSRALVVRGSSRYHTRAAEFGAVPTGVPGAANPIDRRGDVIVFEPKRNKDQAVAAAPPVPKPEPAAPVRDPNRDPKKVWQEHMAEGHFKPRQVIAVADLLAVGGKFGEAAELLKADLRFGVLDHVGVFDALAIALESSGAAAEEVERARLSKIDLDPETPQTFIDLAKEMADLGRTDRAVDFCRRASAFEPTAAEPYRAALAVASRATKPAADATAWAAGNLLGREWGTESASLHQQARQAINQMAGRLDTAGRKADAERLRAANVSHRERDLVIELVWAEQSDVDLTVAEPVGTVCSSTMPRTPAGGLWTGDRLSENVESYIAAQAFSGTYDITAHRVWGQPLGGKVTVKVTRHQGSPNEAVELHTLSLGTGSAARMQLTLADGRRTESEQVPVAATVKRLPLAGQSPDEVYAMLRSMADPMLAAARPGMKAGTSAGGSENSRAELRMEPGVELSHQTKVAPALSSGVDLLTQTTISADRQTMKIRLAPAFDAMAINPHVPLAAVPGGK